jgi:hypothetical protein
MLATMHHWSLVHQDVIDMVFLLAILAHSVAVLFGWTHFSFNKTSFRWDPMGMRRLLFALTLFLYGCWSPFVVWMLVERPNWEDALGLVVIVVGVASATIDFRRGPPHVNPIS